MRNIIKKIATTTFIATFIVQAPTAFAATPSHNNAQDPKDMGQMMQGHSQMGGMGMQKGGQMPMMKMMAQMNEMMATCNKMMKAQMGKSAHPKGNTDKG